MDKPPEYQGYSCTNLMQPRDGMLAVGAKNQPISGMLPDLVVMKKLFGSTLHLSLSSSNCKCAGSFDRTFHAG